MILWKYTVSKQTNKRLNKLTKRTTKSTKIKVVKQNDKKRRVTRSISPPIPKILLKMEKKNAPNSIVHLSVH